MQARPLPRLPVRSCKVAERCARPSARGGQSAVARRLAARMESASVHSDRPSSGMLRAGTRRRGQGREAAAGQLTYPGGGEQEAGGVQEQHDGHQASDDGQFRGHRLNGEQQRGGDLEDTEQHRERIHREQLVEPAQERAVCYKWLNLVCLRKTLAMVSMVEGLTMVLMLVVMGFRSCRIVRVGGIALPAAR